LRQHGQDAPPPDYHLRLPATEATAQPRGEIAVQAVFEAAQVVVNPADLINAAVEQLRVERCELPSFSTVDRMVKRVRAVVHGMYSGRSCGSSARKM